MFGGHVFLSPGSRAVPWSLSFTTLTFLKNTGQSLCRMSFSSGLSKVFLDFPHGLVVENTPAMQERQVQSLGWEDLLEKEMATHSSLPAWRIPWTEELGGLQSMGSQRVRQDSATKQGFLMIRFRLFIVFFSAHTSRQDADLLTSWLC